jgi:catechol 2,3-dioxygenase-like lactoylglutathione lyase family enzyme
LRRCFPDGGTAAVEHHSRCDDGDSEASEQAWLTQAVRDAAADDRDRCTGKEAATMRIGLTSIFVDDQDKAEAFYTEVLGFQVKISAPYTDTERWLSVVSPEDPEGVELVLHLTDDAARAFRHASRGIGRPVISLRTDDCQRDAERLKVKGVVFVKEPGRMAYGGMDAVFDDTCGNLINLHQD